MLYKDIFDPIVYNIFGLGKNRIGQLDCTNNRVDIRLIANTIGVNLPWTLVRGRLTV